jgi:uncharacterized Zn-binding protein involved in type VI secretion
MFPAARKGDPVTHDMLVPSGVIGPPISGPCPQGLVVIENLPAAHLNCTVVCSGATSAGPAHPPPVPPAPPPPIIAGSATVHIHGQPAARWVGSGDIGACGVFLGDPKLLATRTVLIGGPTIFAVGTPQALIQDLINKGKKQEAIEQAVKHYGVDISQAKTVTYDPTVKGEAVTSNDGRVRVGDKAFASPGWLGSSIAHETEVHVNEQAKKGKWYTGKQGTAIQEVQAYDHEIANARKYGLTDSEVNDLKKRRKRDYDELDPEYQKRADKGNYDMKKGDESK